MTGAAISSVSCQNWLATWSEIRRRYASRPSRNPVTPKIAAKATRSSAVARPRPGSVGEERATDIVCYEAPAFGEAQSAAGGVENSRRHQIVDHPAIPFEHIDTVPFAERRQVDSFSRPQGQHDRLADAFRPFEPLALAGDRQPGHS